MNPVEPLRSATFRHLAAGYTVNELGNWIADVALAILVYDRTHSPLATAALFLALRFAPAVVGPVLTARLEVMPGRRVLPLIYLAEAALFAGIALGANHVWLPVIIVLAALDGLLAIPAAALLRGATRAALSGGDLVRRGNALLNIGFTVGGAVGPALAGALIAADGPALAHALDAATFLAIAVLVATAPGLELAPPSDGGSAVARLRSALAESARRPALRRLLLGLAATLLFGAAVIPIEVVFAKRTLHAGDSGYGLLLGAWGVGMIAGSLGFALAGRVGLGRIVAASCGLIALGYAGLAASPTLAVACACSAVGGAGNGLYSAGIVTAIQEAASAGAQNAAMAVLSSVNQLMPAAGYLLGGVVTALAGPRAAYGLAAVGVGIAVSITTLRRITPRAAAMENA